MRKNLEMTMMSSISKLKSVYKSIKGIDQYTRVDSKHLLDIYVGKDTKGEMSVVIIVDWETSFSNDFQSLYGIKTYKNRVDDNSILLGFSLINIKMINVFLELFTDIIDFSRSAQSKDSALSMIYKRYNDWIKLFEKRKEITVNFTKGIIAELLFLKEMICNSDKQYHESIVRSWVGSEMYHQDFVSNNVSFEVKSVSRHVENIKISSLEQLSKATDKLYLVVKEIENTPKTDSSVTLKDVVSEVSNLLEVDIVDILDSKLFIRGLADLTVTDDMNFTIFGNFIYEVEEDFPKISIDMKNIGIVKCVYEVSRAFIEQFKVDSKEIDYGRLFE
jgi:hypothetical protein